MFTKAVKTIACDWSVSGVVKTSQNNDVKILLLVLSFTGIAVSGLILRLKAKELRSRVQSFPGLVLEKAPCHQFSN